jgi:hypothetical protein
LKISKNISAMLLNVKAISLSLILLASACSNGQKKDSSLAVIEIETNMKNMREINLSQFTYDIQYVPLEIQDNLAFVGIWDCIFSERYFLAKDLRKCFLYDYDGNIITKIGNQGRGPGEFQYARNVAFGSNGKIYIQSLYDLIEYNIDGSFSNKYEKSFLTNNDFIGSWLPINDSLIFGKISSSIGNEKNKALIFNKLGEIKYSYKNLILFNRGKQLASDDEQFANIYKFQNEIFFKERFNDTLFYLSNQFDLIPRYVANLGKFSEPISFRETMIKEKDLGFSKEWSDYIVLENVFQTSKYLLLDCQFYGQFPAKRLTPRIIMDGITSMYNTTNVLGIYSIQSKKLDFCKPTSTDNPLYTSGLFNDIDAGPRFFPKKQVNDSTFAMWIEAKQLKDHIASDDFRSNMPKYPEKKKKLEELANKLTEFDNPILMLITFKK